MMLAMIFCFTMNMASKSFFQALNAYEMSNNVEDETIRCASDEVWLISYHLTVTFFAIAVVLNIRSWIYYYIKIGEMASGDNCKRQVVVLDFVIVLYVLVDLSFDFIQLY